MMKSACAESWATSTGCGIALDGESCCLAGSGGGGGGDGRAATGVLPSGGPVRAGGGGDGRDARGGGAGARSGRAEGICDYSRGWAGQGSWLAAVAGFGVTTQKEYLGSVEIHIFITFPRSLPLLSAASFWITTTTRMVWSSPGSTSRHGMEASPQLAK